MIDRIIAPLVVIVLFVGAMIGVTLFWKWFTASVSGDFAFGFVTATLIGCAGFYIIRWLDPPSRAGRRGSAADQQSPRDPFQ